MTQIMNNEIKKGYHYRLNRYKKPGIMNNIMLTN